jgi:hypothetical protein
MLGKVLFKALVWFEAGIFTLALLCVSAYLAFGVR